MKAGSATAVQIDFRCRGGIVMMRRLVWPAATLDSRWHNASICQLDEKLSPRLTVSNVLDERHHIALRSP
jgi:hypothetical protein